jgi:LemA protein
VIFVFFIIGGVLILVLLIVIVWFVLTYNSLISSEKKVENAWAQIDVQ